MERDLQWDFFDYLPVVLQDASTRDVLMVQYMTEEGLARTLDEASMWLWSRSRSSSGWPVATAAATTSEPCARTAWATAFSPWSMRRIGVSATSATELASRSRSTTRPKRAQPRSRSRLIDQNRTSQRLRALIRHTVIRVVGPIASPLIKIRYEQLFVSEGVLTLGISPRRDPCLRCP